MRDNVEDGVLLAGARVAPVDPPNRFIFDLHIPSDKVPAWIREQEAWASGTRRPRDLVRLSRLQTSPDTGKLGKQDKALGRNIRVKQVAEVERGWRDKVRAWITIPCQMLRFRNIFPGGAKNGKD